MMERKPGVEQLEARELMSHTRVIAHRGDSLHAPENTLSSMDQAFRLGADVVEVDVQFAADGVIVAMHDTTVDRTTDGTGVVADLTVPQLKALDAGSWFSSAFASEQVPTLTELLVSAAARGPVYLDLKSYSMGAAIEQVLDQLALRDDSVWASANEEIVAADIHEHLPETPVLWYGVVPSRGTDEYFQQMRNIGVTGFDLKWGEFSRAFVRDARANGMSFSTYVIDQPSEWRAALRLDLDAIETNDPGGLAALVAQRRGQIIARVDDGRLSIHGDNLNNSIRIEPGSQLGSLRLAGVDGTRINGQSAPVEFENVHDLRIELLGGNDVVEIVDVLLDGGLSVEGGPGNDRVEIRNTTIHNATDFIGGAGSDWFGAARSAFDQVQFIAGGGFDILDVGSQSEPNTRGNDFLALPSHSNLERLAS
jgi:glycerophosphoryl diester phosphodiesterase